MPESWKDGSLDGDPPPAEDDSGLPDAVLDDGDPLSCEGEALPSLGLCSAELLSLGCGEPDWGEPDCGGPELWPVLTGGSGDSGGAF